MFAGHIGAGLALGSGARRLNVGWFVLAALWLDVVLWALVLFGVESARIPDDFAVTHQAAFDFPWSHGLLAGIAWSLVAGGFAALIVGAVADRRRIAGLIAAAVFSHWLLDALVHAPELPLAGDASPRVGLGLWSHMGIALTVEAAVLVVGLGIYLRGAALSRGRRIALVLTALFTLVLTVLGMTLAPPPPSIRSMASTSLEAIAIVCILIGALARPPAQGHAEDRPTAA
jgi:hypothetical protein